MTAAEMMQDFKLLEEDLTLMRQSLIKRLNWHELHNYHRGVWAPTKPALKQLASRILDTHAQWAAYASELGVLS